MQTSRVSGVLQGDHILTRDQIAKFRMIDKTSKNTYNREALNTDAIALKKDRQAPPIQDRTELQTYLFELGSEEKIYSISFNGRIPDAEIQKILEVMHSQSYADCPEAVWTYLEQNKLEYSDFKTGISASIHKDILSTADILLKSYSHDIIDKQISRADNYHAVMDYQKRINSCCYEGCYYAVKRTVINNTYNYHIVGQTFTSSQNDDIQSGYFAIRASDGEQKIHTISELIGTLILPPFGCIDLVGILMDIDNLSTAEQIKNTAVK
ncbi:MAG: hypothetical protein K2O91_02205, partial [Lachnospiraceae bacterium]|nr:hypothetical protein [Lachnospiraceae bacterium]